MSGIGLPSGLGTGPRSLAWIPPWCLLSIWAFLVFPTRTESQIVEGWLLDSRSGWPVAMGRVSLVTDGGVEVIHTLSDTVGFFRLAGPGPGIYHIYADRMGYLSSIEGPLQLRQGEVTQVRFRLKSSPLTLDSFSVVAERRVPTLDAVGFYNRKESGGGHFIERSAIEERLEARDLGDLFVGIPGVSVGNHGVSLRGMSSIRRGCSPSVFLDGVRVQTESWEKVAHPMDVEAIEIYRRPSEVPAQYGGAMSGCGVILIWMRRGK